MRRVVCYAAESLLTDADDAGEGLPALKRIVEAWLHVKGLAVSSGETAAFSIVSNAQATVTARSYAAGSASEWGLTVDEPEPAGRFITRIVLGEPIKASTFSLNYGQALAAIVLRRRT